MRGAQSRCRLSCDWPANHCERPARRSCGKDLTRTHVMPVIPSGVQESLDISETARDVSTSLDMTKKLFGILEIYHDQRAHSAAMNMAIDEALLECPTVPAIRFYRWQSPALSFGYFGRFADVANYKGNRDLVRRWTGGGIVFHGEDLTYSILIPANDAAFAESSMWIYEKIHRALCEGLVAKGLNAVVAGIGDPGPWSATTRTVRTALS